MTYCVTFYEEPGALEAVEIAYQCSPGCMHSTIQVETGLSGLAPAGTINVPDGGSIAWGRVLHEIPKGEHCSTCEDLLSGEPEPVEPNNARPYVVQIVDARGRTHWFMPDGVDSWHYPPDSGDEIDVDDLIGDAQQMEERGLVDAARELRRLAHDIGEWIATLPPNHRTLTYADWSNRL